MNDMHGMLDGDRPREALTPEEVRELAAHQAAIAGALDALPRAVPAGLEAAVMARVRAAAATRTAAGPAGDVVPHAAGRTRALASATLSWLWAPRAISLAFRPAYALGVLALVAGALLGPLRARIGGGGGGAAAGVVATRVFVHFRLDAPGAQSVSLAGDFTNWQPKLELHEAAPGVWSIAVPLTPGVHDYAFVVDGTTWRPDPQAPTVADGFGGVNSRVAVLPPVLGRQS